MFASNNKKIKSCAAIVAVAAFVSEIFCQSAFGQPFAPPLSPPAELTPLLKYVSVNSANPQNYFNFLLDIEKKTGSFNPLDFQRSNQSLQQINQSANKLIQYFFLGISLPSDAFWVNLRPDEPDRITSEELSRTDMGRVLLEEDLLLKKTVAQYFHPFHPAGKKYWERLYQNIGKKQLRKLKINTYNRVWIVPDKAIVLETEDGALVAKASLKVLSENEYLAKKNRQEGAGIAGAETAGDKNNEQSFQEFSDRLFKELIIPEITREVNQSKKFASLRQVYSALILAEWFKRKYRASSGGFPGIIEKARLNGLESRAAWSSQKIWQDYIDSLSRGEYKIKDSIFEIKRMYFSGGVSFNFGGAGGGNLDVLTPEEVASASSPFAQEVSDALKDPNNIKPEAVVTTDGDADDESVGFGNVRIDAVVPGLSEEAQQPGSDEVSGKGEPQQVDLKIGLKNKGRTVTFVDLGEFVSRETRHRAWEWFNERMRAIPFYRRFFLRAGATAAQENHALARRAQWRNAFNEGAVLGGVDSALVGSGSGSVGGEIASRDFSNTGDTAPEALDAVIRDDTERNEIMGQIKQLLVLYINGQINDNDFEAMVREKILPRIRQATNTEIAGSNLLKLAKELQNEYGDKGNVNEDDLKDLVFNFARPTHVYAQQIEIGGRWNRAVAGAMDFAQRSPWRRLPIIGAITSPLVVGVTLSILGQAFVFFSRAMTAFTIAGLFAPGVLFPPLGIAQFMVVGSTVVVTMVVSALRQNTEAWRNLRLLDMRDAFGSANASARSLDRRAVNGDLLIGKIGAEETIQELGALMQQYRDNPADDTRNKLVNLIADLLARAEYGDEVGAELFRYSGGLQEVEAKRTELFDLLSEAMSIAGVTRDRTAPVLASNQLDAEIDRIKGGLRAEHQQKMNAFAQAKRSQVRTAAGWAGILGAITAIGIPITGSYIGEWMGWFGDGVSPSASAGGSGGFEAIKNYLSQNSSNINQIGRGDVVGALTNQGFSEGQANSIVNELMVKHGEAEVINIDILARRLSDGTYQEIAKGLEALLKEKGIVLNFGQWSDPKFIESLWGPIKENLLEGNKGLTLEEFKKAFQDSVSNTGNGQWSLYDTLYEILGSHKAAKSAETAILEAVWNNNQTHENLLDVVRHNFLSNPDNIRRFFSRDGSQVGATLERYLNLNFLNDKSGAEAVFRGMQLPAADADDEALLAFGREVLEKINQLPNKADAANLFFDFIHRFTEWSPGNTIGSPSEDIARVFMESSRELAVGAGPGLHLGPVLSGSPWRGLADAGKDEGDAKGKGQEPPSPSPDEQNKGKAAPAQAGEGDDSGAPKPQPGPGQPLVVSQPEAGSRPDASSSEALGPEIILPGLNEEIVVLDEEIKPVIPPMPNNYSKLSRRATNTVNRLLTNLAILRSEEAIDDEVDRIINDEIPRLMTSGNHSVDPNTLQSIVKIINNFAKKLKTNIAQARALAANEKYFTVAKKNAARRDLQDKLNVILLQLRSGGLPILEVKEKYNEVEKLIKEEKGKGIVSEEEENYLSGVFKEAQEEAVEFRVNLILEEIQKIVKSKPKTIQQDLERLEGSIKSLREKGVLKPEQIEKLEIELAVTQTAVKHIEDARVRRERKQNNRQLAADRQDIDKLIEEVYSLAEEEELEKHVKTTRELIGKLPQNERGPYEERLNEAYQKSKAAIDEGHGGSHAYLRNQGKYDGGKPTMKSAFEEAKKKQEGEPGKGSASSPMKTAAASPDESDVGGIDLSAIEVNLRDETFVSSLSPADLKVMRAAKALKDGWDGLSLLYIHEIMLLLRDNIVNDIQNKDLLTGILSQLQSKNFLDPQAINFQNLLNSQSSISAIRIGLYR